MDPSKKTWMYLQRSKFTAPTPRTYGIDHHGSVVENPN